jgi:hypothetical protein
MRFEGSEASRARVVSTLLAIASVGLGLAAAQQSSAVPKNSSAVTGSVAGYVVYDETKLPARFAEIHLVPKPADAELVLLKDPSIVSAEPSTQSEPRLSLALGSTGMDGSFRLDGVPAGDYFVVAIKPGYVTPGALTDLQASEDELKRLIPSLPSVSIAVGQVASVNLTLHRGAVISGRMQFADGSPAIGAGVVWEPADNILFRGGYRNKVLTPLAHALQSFGSVQESSRKAVADDEGRYRLYGLPPGKYVVSTMIGLNHGSGQIITDKGSASASGREHLYPELIVVYEPGVFRRKDAKVFEIRGDERVMDADFKIDPEGLHTLRGKVLSSEDRHAPNGAMVRLKEEGAKEVGRFVEIEEDGSFQINYLPPGSYTLEVNATDRFDSPGGPEKIRYYKTVKLAVVVGEHDVMLDDVLLNALKPGEKMEFSFPE